jgi:serine/threonine protein kinase
MYELLSVVSYLHLRGIVHNDLKPENIMMASEDDDSEIIIGDFGLSKFAMDEERFTMAQGTLAYVSPEVLKGTGYGKEVDLWSCGVILYLLVSGTLPFDSTEREVIIEKTMEGRVPLERKSFNEVSEECKSLIQGLLTVDVERRFTCQQALIHPWFRLRWNERGERVRDVSSAPTQPSSTISSAPISPALAGLPSSHTTPQLGSAPHLFFANSSTPTGGGAEADSSNDREREEDEEDDDEEDDQESESKDEVGVAGSAEAAGAFTSRFINMSDDEEADVYVRPSHSR